HTEGGLRGDRLAAYFVAHPGTLRRDPDAENSAGTGAGAGPHFYAGHEADPDYPRPCQFLARTLSAHQIRAAAEISEAPVAMNTNESTGAVSQLCPNCGLCCNGVLFADVELRKGDDAQRQAQLGLRL